MDDLKACCVLVTATSYGISDPRLRTELEGQVGRVIYNTTGHPLSSAELARLLPDCDGCIAGLDEFNREALSAAHRLKVIARYGVGVDRVDLEAAKEKGIIVTNTPGANAVSVAELTIGLMLCLARSIPSLHAATCAGEWPRLPGVALEGKTVGLLGLGAIGRQVARRLHAFDCVLVAYDPRPDEAFAREHHIELAPTEEVIRRADFLSLHVPLTPETRQMVNADFLSRMKQGAYLINTARGEVVDEQALYEALKSGHLRGAALDAFQKEPPGSDNPLLTLPQVVVTPHTGAHADSAVNAMGWAALRDCLAVLSGREPAFRVV
jgi:D-3-phosphoglycerate dehydrogenase